MTATTRQKSVHFNERVSQCIAVEVQWEWFDKVPARTCGISSRLHRPDRSMHDLSLRMTRSTPSLQGMLGSVGSDCPKKFPMIAMLPSTRLRQVPLLAGLTLTQEVSTEWSALTGKAFGKPCDENTRLGNSTRLGDRAEEIAEDEIRQSPQAPGSAEACSSVEPVVVSLASPSAQTKTHQFGRSWRMAGAWRDNKRCESNSGSLHLLEDLLGILRALRTLMFLSWVVAFELWSDLRKNTTVEVES